MTILEAIALVVVLLRQGRKETKAYNTGWKRAWEESGHYIDNARYASKRHLEEGYRAGHSIGFYRGFLAGIRPQLPE